MLYAAVLILLLIVMYLIGWEFAVVFHNTWPRDLKSLLRLIRTKLFLYKLKRRNATVVTVFQENVARHPHKNIFYYNDDVWTFRQLDLFSNRVATCLTNLGFRAGDEVALFMESKPEYVGIWLGCAKAGIVPSLINTNQRHETLIHSITVIDSKALIYGSELSSAVNEVLAGVNQRRSIEYLRYGEHSFDGSGDATFKELDAASKPFHHLVAKSSDDAALIKHRGNFDDSLFYIYTSGTTGLPKAAIIKHRRFIWIGSALRTLSGVKPGNTIYTCIPLYHLSGGVLGTNQCLIWGDAMVIKHKFSASKFWDDCIQYNCNTAQYIGEICRYLLAQPARESDSQHNVKLIFGNGLRREIWGQFVRRFNIKQVGEFYGSTEGNANIINNDNREGACGFISQILPKVYPVALIKVNEDTGEPVRGSNGLCVRAGPGECGEFVGKIIVNDASRAFDGYVDRDATERRIITDVFVKGDAAFLSGDLLTMDRYGYVYFKDRTGDTFRWKGENVSTTQVEAVISNVLKLTDCVVYGVEVPGCEGRAGMAAILDPEKTINLEDFLHELRRILPMFALPAFLRIVDEMSATGTYKLPKNSLQKEAYNTAIVKDPMFFLDSRRGQYVPLDAALVEDILSGRVRV